MIENPIFHSRTKAATKKGIKIDEYDVNEGRIIITERVIQNATVIQIALSTTKQIINSEIATFIVVDKDPSHLAK